MATLKDERLVLWSPETHHAIKALHQRTSLRHEDVEILGDGSCEEEIFHPRQSLAQADSATWKRPYHYQNLCYIITSLNQSYQTLAWTAGRNQRTQMALPMKGSYIVDLYFVDFYIVDFYIVDSYIVDFLLIKNF